MSSICKPFVLLVAFASICFAQELRIEGEKTEIVKSPFQIHFDEQVDLAFWIAGPGVTLKDSVPTVASVTVEAAPGTYSVRMIAIKTDYKAGKTIPYDLTKEFIVGSGDGSRPPPTDPGKPPPTDPGQPVDYSDVTKASSEELAKLNDAQTAKVMFDRISGIRIDGTLEEVIVAYRQEVKNVLLETRPDTRGKYWNGWRKAVSKAIDELPGEMSAAKFVGAIQAAIAPLQTASKARTLRDIEPIKTTQRMEIRTFGLPPCHPNKPCWTRDEQQKFEQIGFTVKHYAASGPERFEIIVGDKMRRHAGYLSVDAMKNIVRRMK